MDEVKIILRSGGGEEIVEGESLRGLLESTEGEKEEMSGAKSEVLEHNKGVENE